MQVNELKMDKEQARELWRKYQEHRAHQAPHDAEIAAIYKRIAQGRTVIRAFDSIRAAGLNEQGLPRLAIARADTVQCYWHPERDAGTFSSARSSWRASRSNASKSLHLQLDWPGLVGLNRTPEAQVPLIPIHLRPRRGMQNYHILWEAEWARHYPVDPYLIRRVAGDAWLVVAAWDLTPVERAVMSSRLNA